MAYKTWWNLQGIRLWPCLESDERGWNWLTAWCRWCHANIEAREKAGSFNSCILSLCYQGQWSSNWKEEENTKPKISEEIPREISKLLCVNPSLNNKLHPGVIMDFRWDGGGIVDNLWGLMTSQRGAHIKSRKICLFFEDISELFFF